MAVSRELAHVIHSDRGPSFPMVLRLTSSTATLRPAARSECSINSEQEERFTWVGRKSIENNEEKNLLVQMDCIQYKNVSVKILRREKTKDNQTYRGLEPGDFSPKLERQVCQPNLSTT